MKYAIQDVRKPIVFTWEQTKTAFWAAQKSLCFTSVVAIIYLG